MNKLIERTFVRTFRFYKRWGEVDIFFTTAFVLSVMICMLLVFVIAITYYFTGWEILLFNFWPVGVFLILCLGAMYRYFYVNRKHLLKLAEEYNEPIGLIDWFIFIALISMWLLGCFGGVLFRWRYLGY